MTKWKSYKVWGEQPAPGNYYVHRNVDTSAPHHEFGVRSPRGDQSILFREDGVTHYREMDGTPLEQAKQEFHQNFWLNPLNNLYQIKLVIKTKFLSLFMN